MDFKQVLSLFIIDLNNHKIDYGLIGGFAMGLLGLNRSTVDLDFLINIDDISKVKNFLINIGYELLYESENVLQFVSPLSDFGEIDIIVAKREISLTMLKNIQKFTILNNSVEINVLSPEDIIGLKLQAIKNDKEREVIDLNDIKFLIKNHRLNLDKIKEYAKILNMKSYIDTIIVDVHNEN